MDDVDTFLEHFGVRGMKWGVRKKASGDGSVESPSKGKPKSEDAKIAGKNLQRSKKQGVGSLSNQDLKALNERMNLESQYKQLNAKKKNQARKIAEDILIDVAKQSAKELVKAKFSSGTSKAGEAFSSGMIKALPIPLDVMWGD